MKLLLKEEFKALILPMFFLIKNVHFNFDDYNAS